MSQWSFTGSEPRVFPDFGELDKGDVVEAEDNPDPVWFAPTKPAKADTTEKEK